MELIIGNNYETPTKAVFKFIGYDESGNLIMESVRNCMKIQQGKVVFIKEYSRELNLTN